MLFVHVMAKLKSQQQLFLVFTVTWAFRKKINMLIWCSRKTKISQLITLCCSIFLWKLINVFFILWWIEIKKHLF